MPTPVGFDPSTYNSSTNTGAFTLGARYEYVGREFRYVQVLDVAGCTNGDVMVWASTTNYFVTASLGASSIAGPVPAGVGVGTIGQNNYGFILVRGRHATVKDAANGCTAGLQQYAHLVTAGNSANVPANAANVPSKKIGTCLLNGAGGVTIVEVDL